MSFITAKPLFISSTADMFIDELTQIIQVLEKLNIPMPEDSQDFLTLAFNDLFKKKFPQEGSHKQISIDLVNQIRDHISGVSPPEPTN